MLLHAIKHLQGLKIADRDRLELVVRSAPAVEMFYHCAARALPHFRGLQSALFAHDRLGGGGSSSQHSAASAMRCAGQAQFDRPAVYAAFVLLMVRHRAACRHVARSARRVLVDEYRPCRREGPQAFQFRRPVRMAF